VAIFDIAHTAEYAKVLEESGLTDVTLSPPSFLWCLPGRTVTARKRIDEPRNIRKDAC
jgi:hypothetical protein